MTYTPEEMEQEARDLEGDYGYLHVHNAAAMLRQAAEQARELAEVKRAVTESGVTS